MADYMVVGYVSDPAGNEGRLMEAAPVVVRGDMVFTTPGLSWDASSLIEMNELDEPYVTLLGRGEPINEGETVWLAGRDYFDAVSNDAQARLHEWGMKNWLDAPGRGRWRTGSRAEFARHVMTLSNHFESQLHHHLFDQLEKDTGSAESVFSVYRSLPAPSTRQRALNIGLYYFEAREDRAFNIAAETAVRRRLFRSRRQYEKALHQLRDRLMAPRFTEVRAPQAVQRWNAYTTMTYTILVNQRRRERSSNESFVAAERLYRSLLAGAELETRTQWHGPGTFDGRRHPVIRLGESQSEHSDR